MDCSGRRVRRTLRAALVVAAAASLVVVAAGHGHEGHPGHGGAATPAVGAQRAPVLRGFELLGHAGIGSQEAGDLAFFDHGGRVGPHVYLGTYLPCSGGVKIVDVRDPRRPRVQATTAGFGRYTYEDVAVRRIGRRVVLAVGLQACQGSTRGGPGGGLGLVDVTDPARPRRLAFWRSPTRGVHELDLVVRADGRALALLATPHSEREALRAGRPLSGDFRIVDVTRPERPVALADWGIVRDSELHATGGSGPIRSTEAGVGGYASYYGHSVRGADAGRTAYVSYWDAGVLKFDISNPRRPRLVGRTVPPPGSEGDAHSLTLLDTGNERYLLQNAEEIDPLSPALVTTSATADRRVVAAENPFMPTRLADAGTVRGEIADAGDGCDDGDFDDVRGKIALFDAVDPYAAEARGRAVPCELGAQVVRAARAKPKALLVNFVSDGRPTVFRFQPADGERAAIARAAKGIPSVTVASIDGAAQAIRAARGTVTATLTPGKPSWGYLQVFRESAPAASSDGVPAFRKVGEFAGAPGVRPARERQPAFGAGTPWRTIHNTELIGRRAYSSWYSDGVVAIDLRSPARPSGAGQFVPPGRGVPLVWGVAVDPRRGLVYASEIGGGLWIVRPTGTAARR